MPESQADKVDKMAYEQNKKADFEVAHIDVSKSPKSVLLSPSYGSQQYREEDRDKHSEARAGGRAHREGHVLLRRHGQTYIGAATPAAEKHEAKLLRKDVVERDTEK
jgi:hypothetical protein